MSLLDGLVEYAESCVVGDTISCTKHAQACNRFLGDLKRRNTPDFPYRFDEAKAQNFLDWCSEFKHTKGVLTGERIDLHIYLVFIACNIYGWVHVKTGYRRFNKFYLQIARKNAKSQFLSLVASYELMVFLKGGLSEVYCAATKKQQAKIVYDETHKMLKDAEFVSGKWKESYKTLRHLASDSIMRPMSQDDGENADGYNPQCAIIDEYHAHVNTDIYDVMDSGMGARVDPLLAIITTAGFDLNKPCYAIEYKMVSRILDPHDDTLLENYFCDVHELETNTLSEPITTKDGRKVPPGELIDDPYDEENWPKANPVICSYPEGVDYLRKKAKEATLAPEKERNFKTKHLNVWVNQIDAGYMPLQRWAACEGKIPDLTGEACFAGLDLSAKLDLTSAGLVFPLEGKYIVLGHSFMPEAKFHEHMLTDKGAQYDLWKRNGWLTLTLGSVVDYKHVTKWVVDKVDELGAFLQEWDVDPWSAAQLSNDLTEDGYTVVDITQGIKTLSEPTKDFRGDVYENNVVHDGNPVISWAIGNAVVDISDRNMNILLSKKKSTQRIDPIAAIINAYSRAMVADTLGGYNSRPMRSL